MLKINKNSNADDYNRSENEDDLDDIEWLNRKRRHNIILVCSTLVALMIVGTMYWNLLINRAVNRRIRELTASGAIQWVKPK